MFKKICPNVHLSSVGVLELSKVQNVSKESNGTCLVRDVAQHFMKDYPPIENFDLKNQIEAGVPLKEVNSVVFDNIELSDDLVSKIDSKITDTEEDNTND